MEYLGVADFAVKWSLSKRRVNALIQDNRIPGVVKVGNKWLIPKDSERPEILTNGQNKGNEHYMFPIYYQYITKETESNLSNDEQELYDTQLLFLRGEFETADKQLAEIEEKTSNIYVKIGALFFRFFTAMATKQFAVCKKSYKELEKILSDDFPHRRDFDYLMLELYRYVKGDTYFLNHFEIDMDYEYSKNLYSQLAILSSATELIKSMLPDREKCNLAYYEISCRSFECHEYHAVALQMHLYLGCAYYLYAKHSDGDRHLKKAIEIAYRLNFPLFIGEFYKYVAKRMDVFLEGCDQAFIDTVRKTSQITIEALNGMFENMNKENLYAGLERKDYELIGLIINEYSNKEIADSLNVSEKTVERRLTNLYEKTGATSKSELRNLFSHIY